MQFALHIGDDAIYLAAAHTAIQPWLATPEDYARRIRSLVDDVVA